LFLALQWNCLWHCSEILFGIAVELFLFSLTCHLALLLFLLVLLVLVWMLPLPLLFALQQSWKHCLNKQNLIEPH